MTYKSTCVIDHLVGLYSKELKLNRDKIVELNKEFHKNKECHGIEDVEDNEPDILKVIWET